MFKKSLSIIAISSFLLVGCGAPSKYQLAQIEKQKVARAMLTMPIITVKPVKKYTVQYTTTFTSNGQNSEKMKNSIEKSFKKQAVKANADAVFIEGGIVDLPVKDARFKFSMKAVAQFINYTK